MRKLIFALFATLLLSACNQESTDQVVEETVEAEETVINEPSQDELNEQLKEEAVKADFVELNVDTPPDGKKVYIEGEVSLLTAGTVDEFVLTSEEETGKGMYKIEFADTTDVDYSEGDQVRVYGAVNGKDEVGMPKVLATILEKK